MRALPLLLFGASVVVAGCDGGGHQLIVEVRTDLTPGVEFVTVRATLRSPPSTDVVPAVVGQDFITPVRVAELDDLPSGSYELELAASDAMGRDVVTRTVRVDLREDLAVTVALARSCEGVVCPMPGEAATLTTCAGGRCVDPACTELSPELCEPGDCTTDSECTSSVACAVGLCSEGGCLFAADDSACAADESCAPTIGCVGGTPMDAAMDALPDTAPPDAVVDTAVDTAPACATETLLASSAPQREAGGFGAAVSSMVIVLTGDPGGPEIGEDDRLPSGHSGVREFRAADEADFASALAPLIDGSATRPSMAVKAPIAGGAYSAVNVSSSLAGTIITMVRRNVASLTFTNSDGRTDYDATVSWELWGCVP